MPKPKVVKQQTTPFPSTPYIDRKLTTMELATSFQGPEGMITEEESQERVFRAACAGGEFKVNRKIKGGVMDTLTYRHYPLAMAAYVKWYIDGERPMLYASNGVNKDTMLAARGYQDKDTKRFVSAKDATRDMLQHWLDVYNEATGQRLRYEWPDEMKPTKPKRMRVRIT